jgi:signal transduction histidine kinase
VRSVLSVPLWVKQSVIGALTVADTNPDRFTTADLGLVESLAAAASTAIVNAQLYERAQQEIAERKQAEETLRQRTVELQARNEELDAFAHTVAHDLKNPLSVITGFAALLLESGDQLSDQERQASHTTILRSGHKMFSIIRELLLLAGVRQATVEIGLLDMGQIVNEAQQRLANLIAESHAQIAGPEMWPAALGYGPWIEEVWANYMSNALKYGGQPPRIELGADTIGRCCNDANRPDGMARFWVRDNGVGLAPEAQARLFTPFTRLDQARAQGHGLGLSIVRRIVEKLGGQVGVESEGIPGRGSLFYFMLPMEGDRGHF